MKAQYRWFVDYGDPQARLRHGLGELYAYWAQNTAAVANILRHAPGPGPPWREPAPAGPAAGRAEALTRGWPSSDQHQPALAATIRVAVDFHTWQCLVGERGLSEQAAVELAVTWTRCLATPR
jgi:hypothetical protein